MTWIENLKSTIQSLFQGNSNASQNIDSIDVTASDDLIDSGWQGAFTKF